MQNASNAPPATAGRTDEPALFTRRLLHRWFVEYNPLYLVSAAMVLGGCFVWSRGLVEEESLRGPLGVALVAELYAASLIAGAALLIRIRLSRPAVMLALLALLYQWDMTLHSETCAYLGTIGAVATLVWLGLFVAKGLALARALRIRFNRHVVAAALVAATGIAVGPRVLPELGERNAGAALALWLFALVSLYRRGGVVCETPQSAWGETVVERTTAAAWTTSLSLVLAHVMMWWRDHHIALSTSVLAAPLLAVRRVRRERDAWAVVAFTLVFAGVVEPSAFSAVALIAAFALALRACAPQLAPVRVPFGSAVGIPTPYRAGGPAEPVAVATATYVVPVLTLEERQRAVAGSVFAIYLALWTAPWTTGSWPLHILVLDVALALVIAAIVFRTRIRSPLVPLVATALHLVAERRLVPLPRTTVAWGATTTALGFALLGGALLVSYRLRTSAED